MLLRESAKPVLPVASGHPKEASSRKNPKVDRPGIVVVDPLGRRLVRFCKLLKLGGANAAPGYTYLLQGFCPVRHLVRVQK